MFPAAVAEAVLVKCGRCCCLCHKFCGQKIELHHILPSADGGRDDLDNCIALCFDCHAEVRAYDPKHPKGRRFTDSELIRHRDEWFHKVSNAIGTPSGRSDYAEPDRKTLRELLERIPSDGRLLNVLSHSNIGITPFRTDIFEEVDEFLFWAGRVDKEFLDADLERMRSEFVALLNEYSWYLAGNTFLLKDGTPYSVVPDEWEYQQPARYWEVTDKIRHFKNEFASKYEDLVRTGRRKLGV